MECELVTDKRSTLQKLSNITICALQICILAAEKLCLIQVKYLPRLRCQTKAKLNSISMKIYIKKSWSVPRSLTKRKTNKNANKSCPIQSYGRAARYSRPEPSS